MASVIKPDSGELHILGALKAQTTTASTIGKLTIDNADDVDLNNLPANHSEADAALNVQGGAVVGGNLYTAGTFVADGDIVTLGSSGGSLSLNANINSDVLPSTTDTFDLGSPASSWNELHVDKIFLNSFVTSSTATASTTKSVDVIDASTPAAMSLANGTEGQVKMFVSTSAPGAPVVVTPATANGFTSVTFTTAGESCTLLYVDATAGWSIIAVHRASVTI
tara:strand:+ start:90 stop:758 length:669 start_codon:yes stop_codon:yes gene_type:complete